MGRIKRIKEWIVYIARHPVEEARWLFGCRSVTTEPSTVPGFTALRFCRRFRWHPGDHRDTHCEPKVVWGR